MILQFAIPSLKIDNLNKRIYYISPDKKSIVSEPTYFRDGMLVEGFLFS